MDLLSPFMIASTCLVFVLLHHLAFAIHAFAVFLCGLAGVDMPLSPIPWSSFHAAAIEESSAILFSALILAATYTIFIMSVVRAASICKTPMPNTKGVCNEGAQIFAASQNTSFRMYLYVASRREFRRHALWRGRNPITHINELRCSWQLCLCGRLQ